MLGKDGGRDLVLYKLLDASSYRRLCLIEQLVSDDKWWTTETLSHLLNCSRRTLISDIQMINNESGEHFFIRTSKQKGVKLIISEFFHMEDIYQDLVKKSLNFQIIKLIIELDVTSNEDLAELLYTSQSSINRNIKQLNVFLAEYELSIQSNPIKFIGSEKQIRYFYSIFLSEYYMAEIEDFHHPFKEMACNFLDQIEKERVSEPRSFLTHYKMLIWMIVCSDRIRRGHLIEENYLVPKMFSQGSKQLVHNLRKQLPFELPEIEMRFITYIYWNNHREFSEKDFISNPSLVPVYQNIVRFIEKIKTETGYSIDEESFLVTNLMGYYFYSNFFKGPSNLLFNYKKRLVNNSLKTFKDFIVKVKKVVDQYPKGSWIQDVNSDEFIFMLILYWKGLTTQVISNKEKIQISIVSFIGIQQELFLAELLNIRFPTLVDCYTASEKKYSKKEIQLILTDHKVKWTQQITDSSKKVIGIDIIPTKRDWKRIEETIKKIQAERD